MTTASEILTQALALPANERASLAHTLLRSLPNGPPLYSSEPELASELTRRMREIEIGATPTFAADDTLRRAREALERSRG